MGRSMDLSFCLNYSNSLWLLVAPPAWGKTYQLKNLFREHPETNFLFVAPLRALANEFSQSLENEFSVQLIKSKSCWQKKTKANIFLCTPETLDPEFLTSRSWMVVLDEFHLYSYWGTTFREIMWERLLDILVSENPVLALTATWGEEQKEFFQTQFSEQLEHFNQIVVANQTLKYLPSQIHYIPKMFSHHYPILLEHELERKKSGTILYFVPYRQQVYTLSQKMKEQGYTVLSCVGGEANTFTQELNLCPHPDLIICTTVLSHGVNLPPLQTLFLSYPVKNLDFWIQMVGRGGRRGEEYRLYTMDNWSTKFGLNLWSKLTSLVRLGWILLMRKLLPWNDCADES